VQVGAPIRAREDIAQTDVALRDSMTTLLHRAQQHYPGEPGAYWMPHRLGGGAPTPAEAARMEATEAAARSAKRADRPSQ
jgi:hypothetical protein